MDTWYDALIQVLAFTATAVLTYRVAAEVGRRIRVHQKLNFGAAPRATVSVLRDDSVRNGLLNWVQRRTSLSDPAERLRLRSKLARAGFERPAAASVYLLLRYGFALGLPLLLIGGRAITGRSSTGASSLLLPLALCVLGLMLPSLLLKRATARRMVTIEQQFPDALDLMVICMDAGLSLEAGMQRVTREMRRSHPHMAREFERVSEELNAGRSRADALHNMSARLDIPSIRGFVSLLVQSQALGASISQGLKTYAGEMRNARAMRAEEKAMRIPVLISIPLVACFLPVIVQALMLPALIDMIRVVAPAMSSQ